MSTSDLYPRGTRRSGAAPQPNPMLASALAWWNGLGDRERRLVAICAVLVGAALLWLVGLKPALTQLQQAPAKLDAADAQTLAMQRLAVESRDLRGATLVTMAQSVAALKSASARLGPTAKLTVQGDRAVLTVENLDVDAIRSWLAEVRSGARARTVEAQLSRGPKGFSGTVTLSLGAAS